MEGLGILLEAKRLRLISAVGRLGLALEAGYYRISPILPEEALRLAGEVG